MKPEDNLTLKTFQNNLAYEKFIDFYKIKPASCSLDYLKKILLSFKNFPYENISKIIKFDNLEEAIPDTLRMPIEVIDDHINYNLGGTCFSLTFLLNSILTSAGFLNYIVMADMLHDNNMHALIIVTIENIKYMLDPGYLFNEPLKLCDSVYESPVTGVEIKFDDVNKKFNIYTFNSSGSKWRYSFYDRRVLADDFFSFWLLTFKRNSMNSLCLTKKNKNHTIYSRGNFMRKQNFHKKENISVKDNLYGKLSTTFGIDRNILIKAALRRQSRIQSE